MFELAPTRLQPLSPSVTAGGTLFHSSVSSSPSDGVTNFGGCAGVRVKEKYRCSSFEFVLYLV